MSGRIEDRLKELTTLPELEPPAELEPATLTAMAHAARADRPRYFARAAVWVAATGAGALLAVWALSLDRPNASPESAGPVESPGTSASVVSRETSAPIDAIYSTYAEQSELLERFLARLPEPRRVMRTDTASTIVGLEDRIALIDAELDRAEAAQGPPEYRAALMRDRVEVMNALVHVRYAQSRAFIF